MTNLEGRVIQLEGLVRRLADRLLRAEDQLVKLQQGQRLLQAQAGGYGGVGGGGGSAPYVRAADAVAVSGGVTGTADVYAQISGTETRIATAATLRNVSGSPTTTGKVIFLAACGDGSYLIIGQACA